MSRIRRITTGFMGLLRNKTAYIFTGRRGKVEPPERSQRSKQAKSSEPDRIDISPEARERSKKWQEKRKKNEGKKKE